MRRVVTLTLVLASLAGAGAQERARPARPTEELIADAELLPPEFAADALIRIAGSGRLNGSAQIRRLLDEAYERAYAAHEPYRRNAPPLPPDTRQSALLRASDTALNRLSLQLRAVRLLAAVDADRARELFEWIDAGIEAVGCEDPLSPAIDEYYATLSVLARTTYPPSQRDTALRFLQLYLWRAHLPGELPAVAAAMKAFKPVRDEASILETNFRSIVENSLRDPRGFSNAAPDIYSKTMDLEDADRELGLGGWYVTRTLRQYLVTQGSGPACGGSTASSDVRQAFNVGIRRRGAVYDGVAEIAPGDVRPSRVLASARFEPLFRSGPSARLYLLLSQLRGPGRAPVPETVRRQQPWQERADRLLFDLNQWSRGREAEWDFLCEKAALYEGLVDLIPSGPLRNKARVAYIEFLRRSDPARDERLLWFSFVKGLLEDARGSERQEILNALEDSHHPVMTLYAKLERVAPLAKSGASE